MRGTRSAGASAGAGATVAGRGLRAVAAVAVAGALVGAGAAPAAAQDFTWSGAVEAGDVFELRGVNGSITVEGYDGAEVRVTAEKAARRSDPDEVEIAVVEHAGGVTVCALYPRTRGTARCEPGGGGSGGGGARNNDVSVEFTVRLPRSVRLEVSTVNGSVTATGLGADTRASTVNGSVRVETAGTARASTVNGTVRASMGRLSAGDRLGFETVNGNIDVEIPRGAGAEIRAAWMNGSLDTDLPLEVRGRWGPREATGTIHGGGARITLETVNGNVRIRTR